MNLGHYTTIFLIVFGLFSITLSAQEPLDSSGACQGNDRGHFYQANHDFAETLLGCSSYSGLSRDCMRETYPKERLSDGCLACFVDMTSCTVSNCAFRCLFSGQRSLACKQCSIDNCGAKMQNCSGVEPDKWPDFKRKDKFGALRSRL